MTAMPTERSATEAGATGPDTTEPDTTGPKSTEPESTGAGGTRHEGMDLALSREDEELAAALGAVLAKESSPDRVRAAEHLGFDARLWATLNEMGVPSIALGTDGVTATAGQLVLIAEQAGRHLASAPVVESLVTARLLQRCGTPAAKAIAARCAQGLIATLVLHPARGPDAELAPAGAVADVVLSYDEGLLAATFADAPMSAAPNLGGLPLADRDLTAGTIELVGKGEQTRLAFEAARQEWQLLTAAQLVGVAGRALEIAVGYVRERRVFGRPVGSFQSVAHRLADHATAVDGTRLLVREAAWAVDERAPRDRALTTMAFCFAAEQAVAVTADALHYHGGYGFTTEYDIQLYYRRAQAYPLVWGSVQREYQRLADQLFGERTRPLFGDAPHTPPERTRPSCGGTTPHTPRNGPVVNFDLGPESEAFRAQVAAFLDEHLTPDVRERVRRTGSMHDWELHRALASRGWLAAGWPEEYGGQGRSPLELMAMREELKRRHAPTEGMGMTMLVARTILDVGSERMRAGVVPRAIGGEILICLGYTEPQGGSDVASARTKAERDGDEWVINGQKVFTTLAEEASYVFLLTRTSSGRDEGRGKHRGLTMFLVPLDAPGIEIQPIRTIGGERTNTVHYADVRVPDDARVGDVDGGWDVLLRALTYERSGTGEDSRLLNTIIEAAADPGAAHSASSDDPTVRERLARLAIDVEVAKLLGRRSCWVESTGGTPTVEGSMHKLFHAESRVRFSSVLLDLLGPQGLREVGDPRAVAGGAFAEEFRHAVILPIWGGSSEVQRRIIAERGLGLPRSS